MGTPRTYIEDVLYGRRSARFFSAVLQLLSLLYRLLLFLRNGLFAAGILGRRKLKERVISVGNLAVGGTGKTPVVMHIAEVLLRHGKRPVVISRGYGRRNESAITVVSDGNRICADARTGGDEPVLIGSKLKGAPVVAGSDRFRAGVFAAETFGTDTVILDDAFQHVRLRRDLDIVLVLADDPFGNGKLLPAGILREPLSALNRADAVLITGSDRTSDLDPIKNRIRRHTQAEIFTSRMVPVDLINISDGQLRPVSTLRGSAVLAVSGIARPGPFVALLKTLGADVRADFRYADHHEFARKDLTALSERAAREKVGMIVTTEKDAVRLKRLNPGDIWALRIELSVNEKDEWEALLLKTR